MQLGMSALCQKRTHALHQLSINSSARLIKASGIFNASALAVLRLVTVVIDVA